VVEDLVDIFLRNVSVDCRSQVTQAFPHLFDKTILRSLAPFACDSSEPVDKCHCDHTPPELHDAQALEQLLRDELEVFGRVASGVLLFKVADSLQSVVVIVL
jgi:hypothetical protein